MKTLPLIIIFLLTKDTTTKPRFIEGRDYTIHIFENETK